MPFQIVWIFITLAIMFNVYINNYDVYININIEMTAFEYNWQNVIKYLEYHLFLYRLVKSCVQKVYIGRKSLESISPYPCSFRMANAVRRYKNYSIWQHTVDRTGKLAAKLIDKEYEN